MKLITYLRFMDLSYQSEDYQVKNLPQGWEFVYGVFNADQCNFNASAYYCVNEHRVVLAFRGTEIGFHNLADDARLAFGQLPLGFQAAIKFDRAIREKYSDNGSVLFEYVGHSLGSIYAIFMAIGWHTKAVVAESPGIAPFLKQSSLLTEHLNHKDTQIYNFYAYPNVINTLHGNPSPIKNFRIYTGEQAKNFTLSHPIRGLVNTLSNILQSEVEQSTAASRILNVSRQLAGLLGNAEFLKYQHSISNMLREFSEEGLPFRLGKVHQWPTLQALLAEDFARANRPINELDSKTVSGLHNLDNEFGMLEHHLNQYPTYRVEDLEASELKLICHEILQPSRAQNSSQQAMLVESLHDFLDEYVKASCSALNNSFIKQITAESNFYKPERRNIMNNDKEDIALVPASTSKQGKEKDESNSKGEGNSTKEMIAVLGKGVGDVAQGAAFALAASYAVDQEKEKTQQISIRTKADVELAKIDAIRAVELQTRAHAHEKDQLQLQLATQKEMKEKDLEDKKADRESSATQHTENLAQRKEEAKNAQENAERKLAMEENELDAKLYEQDDARRKSLIKEYRDCLGEPGFKIQYPTLKSYMEEMQAITQSLAGARISARHGKR